MQATSAELARLREILESKPLRVTLTDAHTVATLFEIAYIEGRAAIASHPSRDAEPVRP